MPSKRVLIVGTTSDYIDIIARRYPERALFLTDFKEREGAPEAPPADGSELLCDLAQFKETMAKVEQYLANHNIEVSGVACFDDESMSLASDIASAFARPYPSAAAVANSRSKFSSKRLWQKAGLPCPRMALVGSAGEAVGFFDRIKAPVVIKPLTGSGSELTFACRTADQCRSAFDTIATGLKKYSKRRMYSTIGDHVQSDTKKNIVIEELVQGDEYSADFIVDGRKLKIVRIARKILSADDSFGTTLGYIVPADLPGELSLKQLSAQFRKASRVLGISRSMCMVDFIMRDGEAVMLEMAPRPGGDCLPFLIRHSSGFDIFGAALDFSESKNITIPEPSEWKRLIGARIIAAREGVISEMDVSSLSTDERLGEYYLKRRPGHMVILPPEDYDSRILGHIVFKPEDWEQALHETVELLGKINIIQDRTPCKAAPIC